MSTAEIAAIMRTMQEHGERLARVEAAMLTMPKLLAALGSVGSALAVLLLLIEKVGK